MTITGLPSGGVAAQVRFFERAGMLLRPAAVNLPISVTTRQRELAAPPPPRQLANTAPVPLPRRLPPLTQPLAGTPPRPRIPRCLLAVTSPQPQRAPQVPASASASASTSASARLSVPAPVPTRAEIARMDLAGLNDARDTLHRNLHANTYAGRPYLARHAQQSLQAVVLETLRRPGHWNDGAADLVPQVVTQTDMWPAGRSLRIIDCANDAIFLFGPNGAQSHHGRSPDLLPEPAADEIVLMRLAMDGGGHHYVRVSPESDALVHDVPADGDCFYSCLADGLDIAEDERAAFNLSFRDAVARHISQSHELMMLACTPDARTTTALHR